MYLQEMGDCALRKGKTTIKKYILCSYAYEFFKWQQKADSLCYMEVGLREHTVMLVTLPGVVALTLSSLRVAPWLCRQR